MLDTNNQSPKLIKEIFINHDQSNVLCSESSVNGKSLEITLSAPLTIIIGVQWIVEQYL